MCLIQEVYPLSSSKQFDMGCSKEEIEISVEMIKLNETG